VNLFHGRVHEGVLESEGVTFDAPEHGGARDAKGTGFVRPHDIEIDRYLPDVETDGIVVKLKRAHAIGPLAQLDLERADNGDLLEAVVPSERYAELRVQEGDRLVVRPKRLRIFVDEAV
jgi:sulfate transport system ATP-binding protein